MQQIPRRILMSIIAAVAAVTLIGTMIGAFVAFIPEPSGNSSQGTNGSGTPSSQPTTTPTLTPTPTDPRTATINGVSLTLVDIRKSADPKGIEVTVDLANQSKGALAFAFYPARDIVLTDNNGSNYNFRWAEYAGDVKVENGRKAQLVRAFFAGPDRDVSPDHLTLSLSGVPQIDKATWEIDWPATSTKPGPISVASPAPTAEPAKTANGVGSMITQNKVSLTLVGAELNSELGGLLVTVAILNNATGELAFPFAPERNLAIVDNRGSRYNLRWAEYAGNVRVGKGQQVQLVKAFYDGPVSDALTNQLTISVSGIPEFGNATWQVPVRR